MPLLPEERRQHPRYILENSVLVCSNGIFQVTDLSRGGFCFKCPPYTSIDDLLENDIITPRDTLEGFPGKRVWVSLTENGTHDYLPMVVGAKFGRLTKDQEDRLLLIITSISQKDISEH